MSTTAGIQPTNPTTNSPYNHIQDNSNDANSNSLEEWVKACQDDPEIRDSDDNTNVDCKVKDAFEKKSLSPAVTGQEDQQQQQQSCAQQDSSTKYHHQPRIQLLPHPHPLHPHPIQPSTPLQQNPPKKVSTIGKSESVKTATSATPRVKLTRKSPYVIGPPSAILKGTPKPVITRKPAVPKDKPKVPVKPNKLILRSASSSPATRASPAVATGNDTYADSSLSSIDLSSLESNCSTAEINDEVFPEPERKFYRFKNNKSESSPNLTVLSQV